jgi:hypothetical protein
MNSTISIRTPDGKVKLVRVKHEVTYTVPPAPSDCLPAELAPHIQALRSLHAPYPPARLAARRVWFRSLVRRYNAKSDGLWRPDPDSVDGGGEVSEADDIRNSREFPW